MTRTTPPAEGFSPLWALGTIALVLGASAIVARRNSPDPTHPRIRRWYKRLDKPGFTPPDAVFGAAWPVLESGLAFGGYRLLRQPSSTPRGVAFALWLATTGMVGGWTQLFFGEKRLGASAIASGAMLATSVAYVAAADRVDRRASAAAGPVRRVARLRDTARRARCGSGTRRGEPQRHRRVGRSMAPIAGEAGCRLCRLLRVTAYIVGVENWPIFNRVFAEVIGEGRPSRTVLPVPELHHVYLVEVDAMAAREDPEPQAASSSRFAATARA